MSRKYDVLILGASYGSLLGTKLLLAGHSVTLVCTQPTAELINRDGTVVRFPVRGRETLVEISSGTRPFLPSARTAFTVSISDTLLISWTRFR